MAILESSMEEKKSPKHSQKNKKETLLLAQDLNYARNLAANEEKVRKRSLKYLKKYLEQRSQACPLTEENLQILWKGLFYAMWMSDKPLVQEECAENIAHLIHCLEFKDAMLFFKMGLVTMQNEWIGIDQLRLDKFLMMIRRLLRQALFVLKKYNFKKHPNETFAQVLEETVLSVTKAPPLGLFMHFTEIYLEELAKVSDNKLQSSRTLDFIKPYIAKLAFTGDNREIQWINKFIFTHLMKQHKLGLEYEDKYKIWKSQGFVGSINQIQKVVISDEELNEQDSDEEESNQSFKNKPLDPRAGRVDVELPQILFNAKDIAEALLVPKTDPRTSKATRNHLTVWSERFLKLHNGIYPLGVKNLESKKRKNLDNYDTNVDKAAKRLIKFEQQLLAREGGKHKRKRGDAESLEDEGDSEIPNKKKKKNVEIDGIDNFDAVKTKKCEIPNKKKKKNLQIDSIENVHVVETKKSRKEKNRPASNDKDNTDKTEKKPKSEKHISSKKIKHLESENMKVDNELQKRKKIKQKKPTARTSSISDDDMDFNYCFERNSGVWFVTTETGEKSDNITKSPKKETEVEENGEYELFIPSKKFVKKLKKTKTDEEVEQVLSKLRGKSRASINNLSSKQKPNEVTPRKHTVKPGSPKKVVINTKLNVSQEIDDHIFQVISSPQVPWDSSKKPGKPLLKTPVKASPINPFYRLKRF